MSLVGRNIVANLVGGALLAMMMLVLTPLQVRLLGMEAFGVIGFIATLQAAFGAFDLGLASTLTREIAADVSTGKEATRPIVRTALTVYWASAALIGAGLAAVAGPMARDWFIVQGLAIGQLEQAIRVIALFLALRWPVAVYTGVLVGCQRMETLNLIKVTMLSTRMFGGIALLLRWPSLEIFLWWTAANALLEVLAYDLACRRTYPGMPTTPGISGAAVRRVWRFSTSMSLLGVLALLIVQFDRLLISKLMTLDALGSYILAYTAASAVTLVVAAVSTAVLPSFAATHSRADADGLRRQYEKADRVMLFLVTPAAFALAAYGDVLLRLWVGGDAAAGAALPLALLAAGFWVSAVIANAYNVAVASGSPGLYLRVNIVAVLPYLGALYLLIERFGIAGAAAGWLVLNLSYMAILIPFTHRRMLHISTSRWLGRTIAPFLALACVCFVLPLFAARALGAWQSEPWSLLPLFAGCVLWAAAAYPLGLWHEGKNCLTVAFARVRR